ncbi:MAG: O-antigen ligase family protein [Acidobacteriota bacterium]
MRTSWRDRAPAYCAGAAAATATVSIAASQILLGLTIATLIANPRKLRWPPVTAPLALFMLWTLASLAASPDPRSGLPQIKKFYVYLMLFAVFSALRTMKEVRWLAWGVITGGTLSAGFALFQYARMSLATPDFFYYVYSNQGRITGFMDHWMTFSSITMMVLMIAGAMFLFEKPGGTPTAPLAFAILILGVALLAGFQRTMWAGAAVGAMWLLWSRKPWLIALVPVLAAAALIANPFNIRDRAFSIFRPEPGVLDSTAHRAALRATGWEMIKAHPFFGVGPEQVHPRFLDYAPPSVPRPIPKEWSIMHLHNVYYQYAAERGLPALAALLWFLGRALYDFLRAVRLEPAGAPARWLLQAAIASIFAIMVSGFAEVNLGDSEPLAVFLAIVACGYVAVRELKTTSLKTA